MEDIHSAKRNVDANGDMVKRVDAKKLIRYSKLYDMHQWLFFFFLSFFQEFVRTAVGCPITFQLE